VAEKISKQDAAWSAADFLSVLRMWGVAFRPAGLFDRSRMRRARPRAVGGGSHTGEPAQTEAHRRGRSAVA